jgi:hypothetical protein
MTYKIEIRKFDFENRSHEEQVKWTYKFELRESNVVIIMFKRGYETNFGCLLNNNDCAGMIVGISTEAFDSYYSKNLFNHTL